MMLNLQPAGKLEDFFVAVSLLDHGPSPKEMEELLADNEMLTVGTPLKFE